MKGHEKKAARTASGNTETLKKVLVFIKKYRLMMLLSIIMAAVTVGLTLYVPILAGRAIDLILSPGNVDFEGIAVIMGQIAIAVIVTAVIQWVMNNA